MCGKETEAGKVEICVGRREGLVRVAEICMGRRQGVDNGGDMYGKETRGW